MSTNFGSEKVIVGLNENVMDALKKALKKKNLIYRIEGMFIIENVTISSIKNTEVECTIDYEYT